MLYSFTKRLCFGTLCALFLGSTAQAQEDNLSGADDLTPAKVVGFAENGGQINSEVALVMSLDDNHIHYSKNMNTVRPIASISKLMTALVITRSKVNLDEIITITSDDIDRVKNSSSRLSVGTSLTRREALLLALMSSENRAAHALARTYPGGLSAFVREMNVMARNIGMTRSRFVEPTGLSPLNVASPQDLVRLLQATAKEKLIHQFSTSDDYSIVTSNGRPQQYRNTNRLVRNNDWKINISKTGYIREAGNCLVMISKVEGKEMAIVLLNAQGGVTRFADAVRVRHIVQNDYPSLY
ncbi:serine hydrolase [Pelistega suis]|uniref:serine hydrolase n=1 Tax=Pelistega suis TaxID=1631957 RepID=UPI00211C3F3E|nr:serine hydrolase [Pelistega suis]MCQ9328565.1 serine hydrolase [Pelistega suis]